MFTEHYPPQQRWRISHTQELAAKPSGNIRRRSCENNPCQSAGNCQKKELQGPSMHATKPLLDLRPVAAPSSATPGATVYVLLPSLEQLLGRPGFGIQAPIAMPDSMLPLDARRFFGTAGRSPAQTFH
jgi:hypothetical protein